LYQGTASAVPSDMGLMRPLGPATARLILLKGTAFRLYVNVLKLIRL
jgi:hypothetical protein